MRRSVARSCVNIMLWIVQVLVGLHTATGAAWKFSNPEQTVPSLGALPHAVWLGLAVVELVCALVLLGAGLVKPLAKWVVTAAGFIVAEMLLYVGTHFVSGAAANGEVAYWLVVAVICAGLAHGRRVQPG